MLHRTYIRAYRLFNGLKQQEMADKLGVRMATYKAWEYGINRPQASRDQQKLEHFFEKTLAQILGPAMTVPLEDGSGGMEIRHLV